MDLNSSNGTFLEGQKIEPNNWKSIKSSEKVTMGEF
jgi:pSer/pThr/pTyr-binding forkhead associated (FHA) protein